MSMVMERASAGMFKAVRAMILASPIEADRRVTSALYILVVCCNVPGATAARAYGCSKQNVSKALRAVEDRRDANPDYDRALAAIERFFEES